MAICAVAMILVLFVPMWRIDLVAPQYPEGLYLLIHADRLSGNVDIINGLNHYIGMKTLNADDFPEFKILPFIISFFALLFLATAIVRRKLLLKISFILFVVFGVIAMIDFWKWEYDYGHNLNPEAAIKVPGMSYQPPLIGYKQLLNFSAYSMPDVGGWIFVGVGMLLLLLILVAWRQSKRANHQSRLVAACLLLSVTLASCNIEPQPLRNGIDNCSFCKMTLSDDRFGAEIITKKGKVFKFDDTHCLLTYLSKSIELKEVSATYITEYVGKHELINVEKVLLLKSEQLQSPMGGNIAGFSTKIDLEKEKKRVNGMEISWSQLLKE